MRTIGLKMMDGVMILLRKKSRMLIMLILTNSLFKNSIKLKQTWTYSLIRIRLERTIQLFNMMSGRTLTWNLQLMDLGMKDL